MIASTEDVEIHFLDIATKEVVMEFSEHSRAPYQITFSPDGNLLASAGCDRTVKLWDVETGKLLGSLRHKDEVRAVAFSPDGTLLVSGGYDNHLYVWGVVAN